MIHSKLIKRNCETCNAEILGVVYRWDSMKEFHTLDFKPSCECYLDNGDYFHDEQVAMMEEGKADIILSEQSLPFLRRALHQLNNFGHFQIVRRYRTLRYSISKALEAWKDRRYAKACAKEQLELEKIWQNLASQEQLANILKSFR